MKAIGVLMLLALTGCGSLASQLASISPGDTKESVLKVMGPARDRQFQGQNEAWQYCRSGAGIGYNDHRIVWFTNGQVSGLTSYRSSTTGCEAGIQPVRWEDRPDHVQEIRQR